MPLHPRSPLAQTSVILVSFHTGSILFKALESVLTQNICEVIVVDNGNVPSVITQLHTYESRDDRIKILTGHGNIGFGRANNMAVKASRGESILILNPDSYLAENTVERLHAHSLNLSSPFMIGARVLNEDGSDQRGCRRALLTPKTAFVEALHLARFFPDLRLNLEREPIPSSLSPIPAISGAFMFLPRRDFDLIGGFDEGFFLHVEDLDFCYRFRQAGGEIYFAPDVRAMHIGGTSEASSDFIESHKRRGFIRYFHKNFGQKTPWPLLWCLDLAIWMRYLLRRFLVP